MSPYNYDVVVIGAGPGGYVAAIRAAQLGLKTAVIEKQAVGGICLNSGCIPSKALIHVGHLYAQIQAAKSIGIEVTGLQLNPQQVQVSKNKTIQRLQQGINQLLKHHKVDLIQGVARLSGSHEVTVQQAETSQTFSAGHFIVATGSRSVEIPPLKGPDTLSSTEALDLQEIPEHFVVIGGGYIGLEIGSYFAHVGSKVAVVEMMDRLLPQTDPDMVKLVERKLRKMGVTLELNAKAKSYSNRQLTIETSQGDKVIPADKVLVAVGRRPNTENLGLAELGIALTPQGKIPTDLQMRTTVPHIYAIGDIVDGPGLAHKASREGIIAAEVIAGHKVARDFKVIPAVVFTDPEIATVGLTAEEAQQAGYQTTVTKFPFAALGKSQATQAPEGFVKVVAQKETGLLLGVHMVGAEVSNLISEAALAIEMGAVAQDLALTIHPHPTLPEALMEACEAVYGHAIHMMGQG